MSENSTALVAEDPTADDYNATDGLLGTLTATIVGTEDGPGTMSITLACKGAIISGDVIPIGTWHKRYLATIAEASPSSEAGQVLHDGLKKAFDHGAQQRQELREAREAADLPMPDHRFIHLDNARIWAGEGRPLRVGLWRGEVDSIDGWSPRGIDQADA